MKGERRHKHIPVLPRTMSDKQLVGLFQQLHPPQQQASCFDLKYTIFSRASDVCLFERRMDRLFSFLPKGDDPFREGFEYKTHKYCHQILGLFLPSFAVLGLYYYQ